MLSKLVVIIAVIALCVVTVSAISQDELINSISNFGGKKSIQSPNNDLTKLLSAKQIASQIPASTKQIAINEVMKELKTRNQVPIIVWVKKDPQGTARELQGFEVKHIYDKLNGFSGTATKQAIDSLSKNRNVHYFALDKKVQGDLMQSRVQIGADLVESTHNIHGTGITVCHLDSGINYNHPALAQAYRGGWDYVNNDNDPLDDNGHGTSTAGVIVSNDALAKGIATGAGIIEIKVLDSNANGFLSDVAAGVNWCLNNKQAYNIGAISMSLGTAEVYDPSTSPGYIDIAFIQSGIDLVTPVASSGNMGELAGISYPAVAPGVISVGSVYDNNLGTVSFSQGNFTCIDNNAIPDMMSCFSNRAPFLDILAPGSRITSTSWLGGIAPKSGTSLSAPHVAAVIALMKERNPQMTVDKIERILKSTGVQITDPATSLTFHRVDAFAAVNAVPFVSKTGTFFPGNTVTIDLNDPTSAGNIYFILLSFGTTPGIVFPNGLIAPLNADGLFGFSINPGQTFVNNIGVVDSNGRATATLFVPPIPGLEQFPVFTGFVVANTNFTEIDTVSNSITLH